MKNEQEFIEMSNQLKEKYDEITKKELAFKVKIQDTTKKLCSVYGLVRMLDQICEEKPFVMDFLISSMRSQLSELLFKDLEEDEM